MKAYLQVLSTGTADCSPSVILHFDSQRYMINCGEGTQRLCMESKLRFSKLKTILFTRTHWDCMGGAPGMLLTLADLGVRNMKVLGGENLTHAFISTRHFVYRNTMSVETFEFDNNGTKTYMDENLRITAVHVQPENFERAEPYEWPNSFKKWSPNNSNSSSPTDSAAASPVVRPQEGIPVVVSSNAGSKRNSDELQATTPTAAETDEVLTDNEIRKKILAGMFNLNKINGEHPLAAKKPKRDPRAPIRKYETTDEAAAAAAAEGQTDVDMIAAASSTSAASTESAHNCGGAPPVKNNFARYRDLPRTSPNPTAISYICQSPDYVGKFNKQAALDLNVTPGRLFSDLVKGKSVVSETGKMVHPHQVISGARPGRVFMVIDCPTVEYVSELVRAKEFERFQDSASGSSDKLTAACIVHLGDHSILNHPDYKAWMQRFGTETQHIIANQDYCGQKLVWRSQAASCYKLSKLDSNIFPIPYYDNKPVHDLSKDLEGMPVKAQLAESMQTFMLEPSTGVDNSEVIRPFSFDKNYESLKNHEKEYMKEYYELTEKMQEEIAKDKDNMEQFPGHDVVLTALGTGSSHPSKYRNVSANLLDAHQDGTFLLDTGEGTYGQMFRQFGGYKRSANQTTSVDDKIKNLKGIFISHLHADHHLGIVTIIDRWNKLREPSSEPLYMIAPLKFNTFLQELSDVQDFGYKNVRFIESEDIVYWRDARRDHRKRSIMPVLKGLLESSGFEDISTVDVIHCPWSYGISMTHREGWKVVYSGDTRPCENMVKAGEGATVLLHEATFEDDMQDFALKKRHSTTQEAIMVGEGMEAKFTLLTHFSQRYPKIPRFDSEDKSTVIGICFDLMSVRLGEISRLSKFLPALQVLYSPQSDEAQEGEEENQDSELKGLQQ
ncbi:Zinc phosphodiesterase ELAC protein 2 [Mortierella sp. GBA30]|nr:Zinc phosphodiesterase ELAC protein 2 [Mortierella sp. GBA30]